MPVCVCVCLHTDSCVALRDVEQQLRVSGKSSKLTRFGSSRQQPTTTNNSNNNKQWQHLLRNKSQTVQCDMSNALMPAPDYDGTLGKSVRIWGRKSVCCAIYVSVCLYYIYTICVLCVCLYCVLSIA